VINFENFIFLKKPIVLILNDSDKKYSGLIKKFFKGKGGIKIFEKDFDIQKIFKTDPKIIIDINENANTNGVYINASKKIFDEIKNVLSKTNELPFIGKKQANKNKNLEIQLFKRGIPYCYIEYPSRNFEEKLIIKGIIKILKRIIEIFKR
jgi:hypothetical protein